MNIVPPPPTMPPADDQARSERTQTDDSLRAERDKADGALGDEPAAIDETADAVISLARSRADAVLAAARAKTDRFGPGPSVSGPASATTIERGRAREDQVLLAERAHADEVLREERAEHVALLSNEREETDKDLSHERARADEALATRDDFLGMVSHDLRDLLNAIVSYAVLIEDKMPHADPVDPVVMYAQRIQRSGARMNRLIGDLVDVASIEAGSLAVTPEIGDPTQVVTEAVETFQEQASARGISLLVEIVPLPRPVAFDPPRILQVLTNLLSNAIKFTPTQGRVVVRVDSVKDQMRVAVRDTGMGIPPGRLESVFQRFVQLAAENDRRGVGLGLYISKCIVLGHGGQIWAESTVDTGSTFYFTLPLQVAP